MTNIEQAAKYVRSKNAGSFWLTIDIFAAIEKNYMPSDPSGVFAAWIQVLFISSSSCLFYETPGSRLH